MIRASAAKARRAGSAMGVTRSVFLVFSCSMVMSDIISPIITEGVLPEIKVGL
jgi:hypothetical protein